jgi:hypothetical protein
MGDKMWLYRPTHTKGKSPKLQSSWEGLFEVVTRINDVVYSIQKNDRSRLIVVHLDRFAPYQGTLGTRGIKEGATAAAGE